MRTVPVYKLTQRLVYDDLTGILYWDATYKVAGWFNKERGGIYINFDGVNLLAHRVAWAMYYGFWPQGLIDHINGDTKDNRIENLRVVDAEGNTKNRSKTRNNKTGHIGVSWHERDQRYAVCISMPDGVFQKQFKTLEEAVACRKAKEIEGGYHPNHGRECTAPYRKRTRRAA